MSFKTIQGTAEIPAIPKEKFTFVQQDVLISDKALSTKPVGYLKDALLRFVTNRGSLICFFIIVLLILYAIITPLVSVHAISDKDGFYAYATPRHTLFARFGFWDGTQRLEVNHQNFDYYSNIPGAIKKFYGEKKRLVAGRAQTWYDIKLDTYAKTGWVKTLLTQDEYKAAREYEANSGIQLFYPVIDQTKVKNRGYRGDMNAWFLTNQKGIMQKNSLTGKPRSIFLSDPSSPDGHAYTIARMNGNQLETRVLYSEWYRYKHGRYASFLFGADSNGYDICVRLAHGARLSLLLSICVASINLFLGIVIGAIEGYYGGTVDLVLERVKDILCEVPFVVLMTLFQMYFAHRVGPIVSMFVAFIFFGWIGTSSTVRAQFYRFKGQEYVMASRTLGARDSRLIFRHILPNAIGFIITTSVLTIPAVIFSEANLTYLGIVNLQSDTMTSVGTMLNTAQATLASHPHCVFFPAVFISILLVCFNEFGNGLRDAFNPSLRGAEQ